MKDFFSKIKKVYTVGKLDRTLLFSIISLIIFGAIMVYSSSSYYSLHEYGSTNYYFFRHLAWLVIGIIILFLGSHFNYKIIFSFWFVYYIIVIALMIWLEIAGISTRGANRWIKIFGYKFQPSEISKLLMLIFYSVYLQKLSVKINNSNLAKGIFAAIKVMIVCIFPLIFILKEDLSTFVVFFLMFGAMYFITTRHLIRDVLIVIALGGASFLLMLVFEEAVSMYKGKEFTILFKSYRMDRINLWLNGDITADPTGEGMQIAQSLYAIGSGGLLGTGLGRSIQKETMLPLPHNDVIFSVICEEIGFFGGMAVITFFSIVIYKLYDLARLSLSGIERLFIIGLMIEIAVQVYINVGTTTNAIPATGIPLPFISYGGTAFLSIMAQMTIALNISRQIYAKINQRYQDVQ